MPNPYDALWDSQYAGKTAIIDDWHTAMAMVLLRDGDHDVNTADDAKIAQIKQGLADLAQATDPKVTVSMYNDLPAGQLGLSQMWSGDIVNAVYYLPKGTSPDVLRYWFPPDGHGIVDNDMMMILDQGENPVAAHVFMNYLLDAKVSITTSASRAISRRRTRSTPTSSSRTASSPRTSSPPPSCPSSSTPATACSACLSTSSRSGSRCGRSSRPVPEVAEADAPPAEPATPVVRRRRRGAGGGWLWKGLALPGTLWLVGFMVAPLYVVLSILFGTIDPILRRPVPVWNPLQWDPTQFQFVLSRLVGSDAIFAPALVRTAVYVAIASVGCLLIAYPVAYFAARIADRRRGLLLAALIAPFWISYMMRMLAWVNLLQNDGLVNKVISLGGLWDPNIDWLNGNPVTVVFGLIYGYVPYMILPLFAGLDRIPAALLDAGRDLGANRFQTWRRVTWPMSRPAVIAAVILTSLPMLGDYFTSDLLSGNPKTSMVGNLINSAVLTPGQTGQAAAFVLLVLVIALFPMWIYVRVNREGEGLRS